MKKFLLSLLMLIPLMAWADDSGTTGDCTWYFEEATGTLTISGNGATGGSNCGDERERWGDNIVDNTRTLIIEDGVSGIRGFEFSGFFNLSSVTIPNSVAFIDDRAFEYCGFTSVTIPSSVKTIDPCAFLNCGNLSSVYVDCFLSADPSYYFSESVEIIWGEHSGCLYFYNENPDSLNTQDSHINRSYLSEHNQITFPIHLKKTGNVSDICQVQFSLALTSNFRIARDEDNELMIELDKTRFNYNPKKGYSHQLTVRESLNPGWYNIYTVIISSSSNALISGDDGALLNITIEPIGELEDGDYRIFSLGDTEFATPDAQAIRPTGLEKYVKVFLHDTLGDIDSDDEVTVSDYANMVNGLAGIIDFNWWDDWRRKQVCDVNGDDNVSVTDLAGIVNIILYGNWQGEQAAGAKSRDNAWATYDSNTTVSIEPFSIAPGETKEVEVNLSSVYNDLSQAQFDLLLPKGLSVVGMDGELDIMAGDLVASGKRGISHTIASAQREDGTVRVLCLSDSNTPFTSNNGSIVRITVQADENLSGENCELTLSNIKLSRTDASKVNVAGVKANVKVKDSTTDINSIGNNGTQHVDIYSIDGVRTGKLNRGINIIRTADGNTRKILVK